MLYTYKVVFITRWSLLRGIFDYVKLESASGDTFHQHYGVKSLYETVHMELSNDAILSYIRRTWELLVFCSMFPVDVPK